MPSSPKFEAGKTVFYRCTAVGAAVLLLLTESGLTLNLEHSKVASLLSAPQED
jgi:hypothetical protein